jgi:hypothetical protein
LRIPLEAPSSFLIKLNADRSTDVYSAELWFSAKQVCYDATLWQVQGSKFCDRRPLRAKIKYLTGVDMQERTLKNQVVVFGNFSFPPVPDVTLSLMQSFAPFGFMPSVVQQVDINGQMQQKIALTKGDSIQIIFGNDRIDFLEAVPEGRNGIGDFYGSVLQYLICLQPRNLMFNRLAMVTERLVYELTPAQGEQLRAQYAGNSPVGAIEWGFRWVQPQSEQEERVNVCLDVSRLQGMLNVRGKFEQFDGIKIMHDISSSPQNTLPRFNAANASEGFSKLLNVHRRQEESYKPNFV